MFRINSSNIVLAYFTLLIDPALAASNQVLERNVRQLKHNMTVSAYTNITVIPTMIVLALVFGQDMLIITQFSTFEVLILIIASILQIVNQITFFIAYANLPAFTL